MMTDDETFKQQLNRYFTAVVDDQYRRQYPDSLGDVPNGTPIFYDRNGNLRAEEIAGNAGLTGVEGVNIIEESFESWLAAGNTPPSARSVRPGARSAALGEASTSRPSLDASGIAVHLKRPEPVESRDSYFSDTREQMQEALDFRRLEREYEAETAPDDHVQRGGSGQDAIMIELIRGLTATNSGSRSLDPGMMMMMKQTADARQDQNAQLIAMFNAAQQSQMGWIQLLMTDKERSGSVIEDKLLNHALDGLFTKPDTPEESIWSDLIRSGQLPDIVSGAMDGLGGVMGKMRPPTSGPPPYAQEALQDPTTTIGQEVDPFQNIAPEIPVVRTVDSQPTYHEKCNLVMERLHDTLPEDWRADSDMINLLARATEIAVQRAEDSHPMDLNAQMVMADKEASLIANLRTVGLGIRRIEQGEVPVEMARTLLQTHAIYPMLEAESYDSLIDIVGAYEAADDPMKPSLRYDIEYLRKPTTRAIIEQLLAKAGGN